MSKLKVDQISKATGASPAIFTLPAADGAADTFIKTDGSGALSFASAGGGLLGLVVYTGSGTYTPGGVTNGTAGDEGSADVTKVVIEVQGGGAGGSYGTGSSFVGGSGGGYAKKFIDVSAMKAAGQTATISVGGGGPGATGTGAGTDGGDSKWESPTGAITLTVTGVKGVSTAASYGTAAGGAATGGDINIKGGDGGALQRAGGDSMFGHGGWCGWTGEVVPGAGAGYGSGGGGGYSVTAGAGAAGIVLIWEYK